ncbi:hypothetical protein OH76DRAFT_1411385 [Lentinus brumalis]|uniref:Uncharacterized protein n=1 Tax=Lentinus brumalis TaxID=2498619 RepID=A0A371CPK3_9APHY|nr:hypothetical protein OH76DRAFT_1411385 [Polyporus brumalis]
MRLLDTSTAELLWVDEPRHISYAVVSHVWVHDGEGPQEQTFKDITKIHRRRRRLRSLVPGLHKGKNNTIPAGVSEKIRRCCAVAREHGFERMWMDSCCIDKESSSELSEAINSLYNWYLHAKVCYAYLDDVECLEDPAARGSQFRRSRWFRRGWTLQELIAPGVLVFLSKGWRILGTKAMLASVIEEVTGIDRAILTHERSLNTVSVAKRISWASRRRTRREEDEAYSLMGILGVNIPTVYGEGRLAFIRLQEEVLKQTSDQTLFAWGPALRNNVELDDDFPEEPAYFWEEPDEAVWEELYMRNLFALSPRDFSSAGRVTSLSRHTLSERLQLTCPLPEYTMTSHGVRTTVPVLAAISKQSGEPIHLAILSCQDEAGRLLALILRKKERSSSEFFVGAFLPPSMTSEDVSAEFYLGELYFRTTHLSPQFIAIHQKSLRLQEVYIPHRPSRERAHAFQGFTEVYAALTRYSGVFEVHLTGWCKSLLEAQGFSVSRLATDEEWAVGLGGKRGFEVSRGECGFKIQLDACGCTGGGAQRWLRVLVSPKAKEEKSRPSVSSSEHTLRAFTIRHMPDHPDHVCSWSFAAGLASHQFPLQFPDGTSWMIQLTLGLLGSGDGTHLQQSFALGVEILSRSPKEEDPAPPRQPSLSNHWVPPMTILDPHSAQPDYP